MKVSVSLTPDQTCLAIRFPYDERLVSLARLLPGRRWNKSLGAWVVPFVKELAAELPNRFPNTAVEIGQDVTQKLQDLSSIEARARSLKAVDSSELPETFEFPATYPPMQHQKKAIELLLNRANFALFMEMGTAKTYCVLALINHLRQTQDPRALILCPASVAFVWEDQAKQFFPKLNVKVLQGPIKNRIQDLASEPANLYVLNYEATWRMEEALGKTTWDVLALDESTRIKNRTARQTKSIMALKAKRKIIMTGTPIPNSPLEIFSQFKFLDPSILGPHFFAFRDRYAIMGGYQGYQTIGWKNTAELLDKIQNHSFRVLKKDCLDLPDKVYEVRKIELEGEQKRVYDELAKDLVSEVSAGKLITAQQIITKCVKLREITAGFIKQDDGEIHYFKEAAKLRAIEDILEDISEKEKLVVWCSFRAELDQIAKRLREIVGPEGVLELHGDVPTSKRGDLIHRFQDTGVRFLCAQQEAGGLGISLTSASNAIFSTNDYSPEVRLQAEDRLHRKGQVNKVTYHDLVAKGTIDVAVRAALKRKQRLSDLLTGTQVEAAVFGEEFSD